MGDDDEFHQDKKLSFGVTCICEAYMIFFAYQKLKKNVIPGADTSNFTPKSAPSNSPKNHDFASNFLIFLKVSQNFGDIRVN